MYTYIFIYICPPLTRHDAFRQAESGSRLPAQGGTIKDSLKAHQVDSSRPNSRPASVKTPSTSRQSLHGSALDALDDNANSNDLDQLYDDDGCNAAGANPRQ